MRTENVKNVFETMSLDKLKFTNPSNYGRMRLIAYMDSMAARSFKIASKEFANNRTQSETDFLTTLLMKERPGMSTCLLHFNATFRFNMMNLVHVLIFERMINEITISDLIYQGLSSIYERSLDLTTQVMLETKDPQKFISSLAPDLSLLLMDNARGYISGLWYLYRKAAGLIAVFRSPIDALYITDMQQLSPEKKMADDGVVDQPLISSIDKKENTQVTEFINKTGATFAKAILGRMYDNDFTRNVLYVLRPDGTHPITSALSHTQDILDFNTRAEGKHSQGDIIAYPQPYGRKSFTGLKQHNDQFSNKDENSLIRKTRIEDPDNIRVLDLNEPIFGFSLVNRGLLVTDIPATRAGLKRPHVHVGYDVRCYNKNPNRRVMITLENFIYLGSHFTNGYGMMAHYISTNGYQFLRIHHLDSYSSRPAHGELFAKISGLPSGFGPHFHIEVAGAFNDSMSGEPGHTWYCHTDHGIGVPVRVRDEVDAYNVKKGLFNGRCYRSLLTLPDYIRKIML